MGREVDSEVLNWSFVFQGPKKVGMLWREAGLSWREFLAEGQDVGSFVTEQVWDWSLVILYLVLADLGFLTLRS